MIYLAIAGRMGNQLFQYAFARNLQIRTGEPLVIDFLHYSGEDGYEDALRYFNVVDYEKATGGEIPKLIKISLKIIKKIKPSNLWLKYWFELLTNPILSRCGLIYLETDYKVLPYTFNKNRKFTYVKGWFESADYFSGIDDIIRKEITPRNEMTSEDMELIQYLQNNESVCITVRRGNFTSPMYKDKYLVCGIDYFLKSIAYIKKRVKTPLFYVCSDDIEWCKQNLKLTEGVIFERNGLHVWEKLMIMSHCRHFIISNSTFSWWAQHLSSYKEKIVVAPSVWRRESPSPMAIKEKYWIYLDDEQ